MRLCTICARGGSKGVPNKNIRPLLGLPLIAHSLKQARATGLFDLIAVDSDADDILEIAEAHGADLILKRPAEMAQDTSGKLEVIQRAFTEAERMSGLRFETFVDLDATSPLRLPGDIVGAIALVEQGGAGNVITGAPARRSPYFNLVEISESGAPRVVKADAGIKRRQDAPDCYDMNASIYVWQRDPFISEPYLFNERTRLFEMPQERSFDIDEPLDFELVEFLMKRQQDTV